MTNTREEQMIIANEILSQLGQHFTVMTGAKNLLALNSGLQFSLPGRIGKSGINSVRIVLNSMDTYDVTFYHIAGVNVREVAQHEGIYNDMLKNTFETETGLFTSL